MVVATRIIEPTRVVARVQQAWTAFWQDPVQSRCVAGAPQIWQALTHHWGTFAGTLADTRVLDLGCGAGAVARELLAARPELRVTGIDFARIPLTLSPQVELLSDTPMESMPFAEGCFGAVVSQFGIEYSSTPDTARELARVLSPGAKLSFLVHHAESSIVATNRTRLNAVIAILAPMMRNAFCSGDVAGFQAHLSALAGQFSHDTLIAELAQCLPSRLYRTQRERVAIWNAIEDALAPERCLAECLNESCVAPEEIEDWLVPLREVFDLPTLTVLREPNGAPVAWRIEGAVSDQAAS